MESLGEIVEEEAVVDDFHIVEEEEPFNDKQYEFVEVDDGGVDVIDNTSTAYIVTCKPSDDPSITYDRIRMNAIDDALFDGFCAYTLDKTEAESSDLQHLVNCLYASKDWGVGRNFQDAIIGPIDPIMVHMPTKKFFLRPSLRDRLITDTISACRNDRNPVGAALQSITRSYIGFPPIVQLRNILSEELQKVFPLGQSTYPQPQPTRRSRHVRKTKGAPKRQKSDKKAEVCKPSTSKEDQLPEEIIEEVEAEEPPPASHLNPYDDIADEHYDTLAQLIAGRIQPNEVDIDWPPSVVSHLQRGALVAEYAVGGVQDEFTQSGWRIRERESGRIVPRKREVHEIWCRIHERMIRTNSLSQIVAFVHAKYIGISNGNLRRAARADDMYKGSRVAFPQRPKCVARKPMQYVQIDIIESGSSTVPPEYDQYHQSEFDSALIIIDLYSQFVFVKPIVDSSQIDEILRYVMDSFSAFGPPEAFVTATDNHHAFTIHQLMSDMERIFKIRIKNTGITQTHVCSRTLSLDAHRRSSGQDPNGAQRWSDALPTSVIDWNQRPNKFFDFLLSPFEVMFGRRPWSIARLPPWIGREEEGANAQIDEDALMSDGEMMARDAIVKPRGRPVNRNKMEAVEKDGDVSLVEKRRTITKMLSPPDPKVDTENERVLDPGTGLRYDVGDRVYVRNPLYVESGASSRRNRIHGIRYFRGIIVEDDDAQPEFLYRVVYDGVSTNDNEVMSIDEWPTFHDDNNDAMDVAWFSPFDVAPSTFDQQKKRNSDRIAQSHRLCACENDNCDLMRTDGCTRDRSVTCCARHTDGPCEIHKNGRKRKSKETECGDDQSTSTVSRDAEEEEEEDANARYVYQNGSIIKLKLCKRYPTSVNEEGTMEGLSPPLEQAISVRPRPLMDNRFAGTMKTASKVRSNGIYNESTQ